jgi:hypothetical protein
VFSIVEEDFEQRDLSSERGYYFGAAEMTLAEALAANVDTVLTKLPGFDLNLYADVFGLEAEHTRRDDRANSAFLKRVRERHSAHSMKSSRGGSK